MVILVIIGTCMNVKMFLYSTERTHYNGIYLKENKEDIEIEVL